MRILITGSSGHLGEAMVRVLVAAGYDVLGLDVSATRHTDVVGSITDRACVRDCMAGADAIVPTATLHKPHVASHCRQDFVDTNVTGTLTLLEEAVRAGAGGSRCVVTAVGVGVEGSCGQGAVGRAQQLDDVMAANIRPVGGSWSSSASPGVGTGAGLGG